MPSKSPDKIIIAGSEYFVEKNLLTLLAGKEEAENHSYYADEFEPADFFNTLYTPSLFQEYKVLVLHRGELLKKPEAFFENFNSPTEAVVIITSTDLKKSIALQKAGKNAGFDIKTEGRQTSSTKSTEIRAIFNEKGVPISEQCAHQIGAVSDWDMSKITHDAEKLSLYFRGKEPISSQEILGFIGGEYTETNFAFLDAFMERQPVKCMKIYPHLQDMRSIFYMLTTYMGALYFKLRQPSLYTSRNPLFNGKDYFMRTIDKVHRQWKAEDAARIIDRIGCLEIAIKTGQADMEDAVLLLIKEL